MKIVAQTLLITFFMLFFVIALMSAVIKFEILNYNFWITSFNKHNVYTKLSQVVHDSVDNQIGKAGGDKKDIAILTDLVTPGNTEDFVNKNLLNLLNFMNANTQDLEVYIPVTKIPSGVLPKSIADLKEQMTITDLITRFNIVGLENMPIKNLSKVGVYDYYILMVSVSAVVICMIFILLLIEPGSRFIAPGMSLILSGFLSVLIAQSWNRAAEYLTINYSNNMNINKVVIATIAPPILTDLSVILMYVGGMCVIIGVSFFWIKKHSVERKIPLND